MKDNKISVSLILCTLGRTEEVKEFLKHSNNFTRSDFEIIIADQNEDNRIEKIISELNKISYKILHLKTPLGLSKSRNFSISYAKGEFIAFPDDDCLYDKNTLEKVINFFNSNLNIDILIAKWQNPDKNGYQPHTNKISHIIDNPKEIFTLMSSEIFVRRKVFNVLGNFDTNLGLGSGTIFKGGEDYDFLLRCFNYSFKIYFNSDINIYHPWKGIDISTNKERVLKYLKDIEYAGASDFYVMYKNFNRAKTLKIVLNNIFKMLYLLIIFDYLNYKIHLHRIMGFVIAIKYLNLKK